MSIAVDSWKSYRAFAVITFAFAAFGCSSSGDAKPAETAAGGSYAAGGSSALASTELGGNIGTGGSSLLASSTALGGAATTGGATSSGTTAGTGGTRATGGSASAGGTAPTGGSRTTGGTSTVTSASTTATKSTGGAVNVGGTSNLGGRSNAGGTSDSGGASATGGSAALGGDTAAGGTSAATGLPALHVEGKLLLDVSGKTIVLRGVSLIDIGELYYSGNQNAAGIKTRIDKVLAVGMQPRVIRLPVYPRTVTNGNSPAYSRVPYPLGPNAPATRTQIAVTPEQYLANVLKPAVDYVTEKGMYVIIDYHQIDNTDDATRQSAADANTFWQFMADKFKDYSNVLYEAFNEPIDQNTTWATFKPRAQKWVDTIRAAAPNNVIIVPSMIYCQRPGDAAESPLTTPNLMYTAHMYPGNWNTTFQAQVAAAVAKVPVFITEWGYDLGSTQNPTGTNVATWGTDFRTLVDGYGASWTAWVTDASWSPRMFSDTSLTQLTDFGTLTKKWLADEFGNDWVQ